MKTYHLIISSLVFFLMLIGYGTWAVVYAHSTFVEDDNFTSVMRGIDSRLTSIDNAIKDRCGGN